ncbi:MAG: hypothetical protein QM669_11305 [Siphonobacter sp.]
MTYGKFIDQTSSGEFERKIFQQSYDEFALKCQEYNPSSQFFSLSQMTANNPKANSLHYKTALAIGNTIKELNHIIPDLKDTIGNKNIPFEKYEMKILESNPFNKADHRIVIYFTTPKLCLHEIINSFLVLSRTEYDNPQDIPTFTLNMHSGISITNYSGAIQSETSLAK